MTIRFLISLFTLLFRRSTHSFYCEFCSFNATVMFSDLSNFLDVEVGRLPAGQCILTVEISGSDGSFVLHHFLSLAMRGQTAACLVGLAQTFHHYACVGNKLTVNLARLRDSGKLKFVDGLRLIGGDFVKSSVTAAASDIPGII